MEAAHLVCAPFVGRVWCCPQLCVNAPAGRQSVHVLAARHAITPAVITVPNLPAITAETVGER